MTQRPLTMIAVAALLVVAPLLGFGSGRGESGQGSTGTTGSVQPTGSPGLAEATKNLATIQYSFREVAKKVLPVVVEVDVTEQAGGGQTVNPFDWFFNQQPGDARAQPRIQQGLGSGIIVKRAGDTYYVLTNNHVVDSATTISVKLQDQTVFSKVKVVGNGYPPGPRRRVLLQHRRRCRWPTSATPGRCRSETSCWPSATPSGSRTPSPWAS